MTAWSVVLTGVSRGLGAALFSELTGRGDRVLAVGRHFSAEQRALAGARPDAVGLVEADLSDPDAVPGPQRLREFLRRGDGECVLVHNAATVEPIGAVGALAPADIARAVTLNLTAPMLLTNAFLAARPDGRAAHVLFVSSGAAHRVIDGWAVYSATKRGAEMFIDALAGQPGVRATSVNPGVMDTAMQETIRAAEFPERDHYARRYQRGELADPAAVARRIIDEHLGARVTRRYGRD